MKRGLVSLFAGRIRKIVFSDGDLPFAPVVATRQMHSTFESMFPENLCFASTLPKMGAEQLLQKALRHALKTLLAKTVVSPDLVNILAENVPHRFRADAAEYQRGLDLVEAWNERPRRQPKPPKPPAKKTPMPKPKTRRLNINLKYSKIL